jgi:DNA polymerase-3 subunit gamma/tau
MGKALYRKYRSKSLDEIVGQSHITTILQRAVAADHIAHAYLLTGPRGVGKTSIARILAHEINKLPYTDESTHLDIIEIDAASNNSVEDIRDLREKVQIAPVSAARKIYIIDEVHMLSKSAFNALLKTLGEPPEHVVFILATTDLEKLPATIVSRVQQFNFRAIGEQDAIQHLKSIAALEHINITDDAIKLIATHGKGSFRDSISLLDQLSHLSNGPITSELIEGVLGLADADTVARLIAAYEASDLAEIVRLGTDSEGRGTPAIVLTEQLIQTIRSQILEKPHLLPLLDRLLEIARSAWPHIKLLTALTSGIQYASPSVPPLPVVSQPQKTKPSKSAPAAVKELSKESVVVDAPLAPKTGKKLVKQPAGAAFPWTDFLAILKEDSMGATTILGKCAHEYDGHKLTIYAGRPFTKKQIDKYLAIMQKALQAVGITEIDIAVLAEPKPASDSQTAAVLAMMGGGEEVSL